jgi:hypothetical protein
MKSEKLLTERLKEIFSDYDGDFTFDIELDDTDDETYYFAVNIEYGQGDFSWDIDTTCRVHRLANEIDFSHHDDVWEPLTNINMWQWIAMMGILRDH